MSNGVKRSVKLVALYAGVWQFVAKVADARKHGRVAGVCRTVGGGSMGVLTVLHHPKKGLSKLKRRGGDLSNNLPVFAIAGEKEKHANDVLRVRILG